MLRSVIRPGVYYDSVVLMRVQRSLAALPDVLDAGVVMATPANREILAAGSLLPEDLANSRADDLLIVIRAASAAAAEYALSQLDELLRARRTASAESYRPHALTTAIGELPDARWVMISVPGEHAAALARQALDEGKNVFLYSDNVTLTEELELKQLAGERGLLMMGPDCGTAILSGVGFGFANRVRRGGIGLIGASGTGLQAIASRIHELGGGLSHALGTGGRDLHQEIGGLTALAALDLLSRDEETRVIVLVSKPPAPGIATRVLAAARRTGKPVVVHFLGQPRPERRVGTLHFATSLAEAAEIAAGLAEQTEPAGASFAKSSPGALLRGLFSGGTLAAEALLGLRVFLRTIASNVGHDASYRDTSQNGHRLLDLGDDEFTVGRPHPMIDLTLLRERIRAAATESSVGVVLLDVVLGDGAHADPASELAPEIAAGKALAASQGRALEVVVIVIGTEGDPQDLARQVAELGGSGATVVRSVGEAIERVTAVLAVPTGERSGRPVPIEALRPPVAVINVGLESFHDSLVAQGAATLQMDWKPPAGGNRRLTEILAKMGAPRR